MYQLFIHHLKEKSRATFWQKSAALNLLLIFATLMFIVYLLVFGYYADEILLEIFPDEDILYTFSRMLFYYFIAELFGRFLLQALPVLTIEPYLLLPVKRKTLVHYLILKSVPSPFNVFPFLLILPFFIKVITPLHPYIFSFQWLFAIGCLVLVNNFINILLKRSFTHKPLPVVLFLVVTAIIMYLDYAAYISLSKIFSQVLLFVSKTNFYVLLFVTLVILAYGLVYIIMLRNFYTGTGTGTKLRFTKSFAFLNQFGVTGHLMVNELKLILRNKRPRSLFYISLIFMLYGFLIYEKDNLNNDFILMVGGYIVTAGFMMNYGQFLFSWEGSYYPVFMINNFNFNDYIKAKYFLLCLFCVAAYLLTLAYALIDIKIAFIQSALFLYNVGVTALLLLYFASYNKDSIDLSRSPIFNYQGVTVAQFLFTILIFLIPVGIYLVFKYTGLSSYFFFFLGFIGVAGIVLHNRFIFLIEKRMRKRKYKMLHGFKQKN